MCHQIDVISIKAKRGNHLAQFGPAPSPPKSFFCKIGKMPTARFRRCDVTSFYNPTSTLRGRILASEKLFHSPDYMHLQKNLVHFPCWLLEGIYHCWTLKTKKNREQKRQRKMTGPLKLLREKLRGRGLRLRTPSSRSLESCATARPAPSTRRPTGWGCPGRVRPGRTLPCPFFPGVRIFLENHQF